MKSCEAGNCKHPSFGKDKITGIRYCKSHQMLRTDTDRRSSAEKHYAKFANKEVDEGEDSFTSLSADLDRVVSRYVRLKEANSEGIVSCFTCDRPPLHYLKMHCSHFVPRVHLGTRWLIQNLRPACVTCNVELRGNLEVYAQRLESDQKGIVEWLQEQGRTVVKPSRDELKQMLFDFQQRLKNVESKLK